MSEKKESDSFDQNDHVFQESVLTESFNKLHTRADSETSDDDFIEEYVKQIHFEKGSKEIMQAYGQVQNAIDKIMSKSFRSASSDSKTNPEIISLEAVSDKVVHAQLTKYCKVLEQIENSDRCFRKYSVTYEDVRTLVKKIKQLETKGCTKDCPSTKDTQMKAFSSPESDLEVSKKNEITRPESPINLQTLKETLLKDISKRIKELRKRKEKKRQKETKIETKE